MQTKFQMVITSSRKLQMTSFKALNYSLDRDLYGTLQDSSSVKSYGCFQLLPQF